MKAKPLTYKQACDYITANHRHHKPPQGWLYGIGAEKNGALVGVVCVGRPTARMNQDGRTCEVTRLCTDGTRNVCSFLYSAARRVARELGYHRMITYILESEPGTSLKASGWTFKGMSSGGSWSRPSRMREDKAPLVKKQIWEVKP